MEIEDQISTMKEIYSQFIEYINDNDSYEPSFQELIKILEKQKIIENKSNLLFFLNIISNVSKNCHRTPDNLNKIYKILLYIFNDLNLTQILPNSQIFHIFEDDKLVILFLLKNKFLEIDYHYFDDQKFDRFFFYLEIKEKFSEIGKKIEKELLKLDPNILNDFDQKRQIGENDSQICFLIRNDLVIDFITHINKSNISINSFVKKSIFETNSFLLKQKNTSLIEYAAFFGSFQIFQYLLINEAEISYLIWLYAVHGRNPDIIHLIEENGIYPIEKNGFPNLILYEKVFLETVKCHFNEIAEYIKNKIIPGYLFRELKRKTISLSSSSNDKIHVSIDMAIEIYKSGNYKYFPYNLFNSEFPMQILCSSFEKITIPNVSRIPFNFFSNCKGIKEVIIPSSVVHIEANAFMNCKLLSKVNIPYSVKRIEGGVFQNCESLVEITIPPFAREINDQTFQGCKNLREIIILSSLVRIGNSAFCGCQSLVCINIPSSLISIGERAFESCTSLKNMSIHSLVTKIGKKCFDKCSSLTQVLIHSSLEFIEPGTFQRCSSLNEISLPSSLIKIGDCSLRDCTSLEKFKIPDSVISIGFGTFINCSSLKEILIPSSVTVIGDYAFDKCISLKKISIPSSLTSIGNNAFPSSSEIIKY